MLGTVATLVFYHLRDALERLRGLRADARDDHAPLAAAPAAAVGRMPPGGRAHARG